MIRNKHKGLVITYQDTENRNNYATCLVMAVNNSCVLSVFGGIFMMQFCTLIAILTRFKISHYIDGQVGGDIFHIEWSHVVL